jgi:hypothetical protein
LVFHSAIEVGLAIVPQLALTDGGLPPVNDTSPVELLHGAA